MPNLGSQFYDPFEAYENIEFEHHGEGWEFDEEEENAPVTHGSLHVPGRRIPVKGTWRALSAPRTSPAVGESVAVDRHWEDFKFHALSEVPDTDYEDRSSPFMDIGVMLGEGQTPERSPGGSAWLAGRPVGVDLAGIGVDKPGYYPVDPPHSTVHTEGFWTGPSLDPELNRIPENRTGKQVLRWAQDPGGEPQGPGASEFGTKTTDWVRERDLQGYRRGSRQLASRSDTVNPIEQLTSPEGVATLSSSTGDAYEFYTREMDRYMEHLRGGDEYFEKGTHGQEFPERPNLLDPKQRPQKPETETGEQIGVALDGLTEGLLAAFAPKKVPAKRERPIIPMKYVDKGTEGMWGETTEGPVTDCGLFGCSPLSTSARYTQQGTEGQPFPWSPSVWSLEQANPLPDRRTIEDSPNPLPDTDIPLPSKPEYEDEREHVSGQKTGRKVLKHPPAYEKPPKPQKGSKPKSWGMLLSQGSLSQFNDGHEGQLPSRAR